MTSQANSELRTKLEDRVKYVLSPSSPITIKLLDDLTEISATHTADAVRAELTVLKRKATQHCAFKINQSGSELDTEDVRLAVTVKNIDTRLAQLKDKTKGDA